MIPHTNNVKQNHNVPRSVTVSTAFQYLNDCSSRAIEAGAVAVAVLAIAGAAYAIAGVF